MRYSDATLRFFWLGRKLFGGRFVRFMSGLKNETDLLSGHTGLSPSASKINFACPSESVLRDINPLENFPMTHSPGLLSSMIDLKAKKDNGNTSYVLMFDGKKVRKGGDVDLLGFEEGSSLEDRKEVNSVDKTHVETAINTFKRAQQSSGERVTDTTPTQRMEVSNSLKKCFGIVSENIKNLRHFKMSKEGQLRRLRDKAVKECTSYAYAIDFCRTYLYQVENCLSEFLDAQWMVCKAGASLNNAESLFPTSKMVVNISQQENVRLLPDPEELRREVGVDTLATSITKQRSPEWFDARRKVKVTGSTVYSAIGCDGLKKQREHFDRVVSGVEPGEPNVAQQAAMQHGTESEVHQMATLSSIIMPFLYPHLTFYEERFYLHDGMAVSPDGSLR